MSIRRGRRYSSFFSLLLACAILFTLAAATRVPTRAPAPDATRRQPIMVNRRADTVAAPGAITLAQALARASGDPRDNLIGFDADVFGNGPVVIRLAEPITAEGSVPGHDLIDGGDRIVLDASSCPDAGVIVGREARLTLRRLTVKGGGQRAVLVKDNGRLTLERVTVSEGAGPGVALFGQATVSLSRCRLTNNHTHGLELHGESTARLDCVDLTRNGQSGLVGFDRSVAAGNDIRLDSNGDWNVALSGDSRLHLTGSLLRRGRFANADVSGAAGLRLTACTLEEGPRFGLFATGRSVVELIGTRVHRHGGRGLELQDQAALNVEESRIEGNGDYGLILFGRSRVQAAGTVIALNAAHGASLRGHAEARFSNCQFVGNRYSGIGCPDHHDGGPVCVTQCSFQGNGMRPIYRGPTHLDPLIPTPLRVQGPLVTCMADPHAAIELFLDRAGEAMHYLRTIHADDQGRFVVSCRDAPEGWVMTASATSGGATSEFNVIAGTAAQPVINALLGKSGPLSDNGGTAKFDMLLRRWRPETRLIFNVLNPPSVGVQSYMRFLVERIGDWTAGAITAEVRFGKLRKVPADAVVVPVRYVPAESPELLGRGGVTFMKWDAAGFFLSPMAITLAIGKVARETCPRVLAHEVGHALGLCHARVGLLSRMQGSIPPGKAFVNDFSPMMTYYDVLALQLLHDPRNGEGTTLRQVVDRGTAPQAGGREVAASGAQSGQPTFSPAVRNPQTASPRPTPLR